VRALRKRIKKTCWYKNVKNRVKNALKEADWYVEHLCRRAKIALIVFLRR